MKPSKIQEIRQAQLERSVSLDNYSAFLYPNYSQSQNLALATEDAISWVDKASRSASIFFKLKNDGGSQSISCTSLGRQFLGLLPYCLWLIQNHVPQRRFDTRVELLLEVISSRRLNYWPDFDAEVAIQKNPTFWVDTLNACVLEIRSISNRRTFTSELEKHRNTIDQRFRTLRDYFNQLDKSFPCCVVLRLDLVLKCSAWNFDTRSDEKYAMLKSYSTDWLKNTGKFLGVSLVGNAWKHDVSWDGAYRTHIALILNGPQGTEIPNIISMLASEWDKLSAGSGYCVDCHSTVHPFEFRGLHYQAAQHFSMRAELHNCAVYIARTDGTMRVEFKDRPPAYGMGATQPQLDTKRKWKQLHHTSSLYAQIP
nr:hypothetical protein [uncultured Albidiferax sp.]